MMKKIIVGILGLFVLINITIASEVQDELYYKREIQNQRFPYNVSGMAAAIVKDRPDIVDCFIKAGFGPDSTYMGSPMLIFAIYQNKTNCVKVLLDNGADPNTTIPAMYVSARSTNALMYSIQKKDSDSVKYLIEHNVDVNKPLRKTLPIDYAIKAKQTKIVQLLLDAGAVKSDKTLKLVNKSKDEYLKDLFNLP